MQYGNQLGGYPTGKARDGGGSIERGSSSEYIFKEVVRKFADEVNIKKKRSLTLKLLTQELEEWGYHLWRGKRRRRTELQGSGQQSKRSVLEIFILRYSKCEWSIGDPAIEMNLQVVKCDSLSNNHKWKKEDVSKN